MRQSFRSYILSKLILASSADLAARKPDQFKSKPILSLLHCVETHSRLFAVHFVLDKPPENWGGPSGYISQAVLSKTLPAPALGDKIKLFVCASSSHPRTLAFRRPLLTGFVSFPSYRWTSSSGRVHFRWEEVVQGPGPAQGAFFPSLLLGLRGRALSVLTTDAFLPGRPRGVGIHREPGLQVLSCVVPYTRRLAKKVYVQSSAFVRWAGRMSPFPFSAKVSGSSGPAEWIRS